MLAKRLVRVTTVVLPCGHRSPPGHVRGGPRGHASRVTRPSALRAVGRCGGTRSPCHRLSARVDRVMRLAAWTSGDRRADRDALDAAMSRATHFGVQPEARPFAQQRADSRHATPPRRPGAACRVPRPGTSPRPPKRWARLGCPGAWASTREMRYQAAMYLCPSPRLFLVSAARHDSDHSRAKGSDVLNDWTAS